MTKHPLSLVGLSALFAAAALASAAAAASTNPATVETGAAMAERTAQPQLRRDASPTEAARPDAANDKRKGKPAICLAPSKTPFACRSRR